MWLSGQQKRATAASGEGQVGTVTMSAGELAVELDSERRGLEVYAPAGYRWTPKVGQKVLVIKGAGEIPCVVGTSQRDYVPDQVTVEAQRIDLQGQVLIRGTTLEKYITSIVGKMMEGSE